jgi:hypothetical protein
MMPISSREGSHGSALSLLLLLGLAIGLHVYAVRVKDVQPSRYLPRTSLSPDGSARVAGSQSSRIERLLAK